MAFRLWLASAVISSCQHFAYGAGGHEMASPSLCVVAGRASTEARPHFIHIAKRSPVGSDDPLQEGRPERRGFVSMQFLTNSFHFPHRRAQPSIPASATSEDPIRQIVRERSRLRRAAPLFTLLVVVVFWQLAVALHLLPIFLLPSPMEVLAKFPDAVREDNLMFHLSVTIVEIVFGLFFGVSAGVILGYLIARQPLLEETLSPLVVTLQSTPVVAYAPLLVIWFGSGATSKILICALIVSFPMLMNTVVGVRSVPGSLRDLMALSQATRWQTFAKLEVPAAMPILLNGLKTAATLAVIGAIVGEFVNPQSGLGYLIIRGRTQYDTPLVFVTVIVLAITARVLYGGVSFLESRLLRWQRFSR
jgi:NitT/TauT family transport system permease protein